LYNSNKKKIFRIFLDDQPKSLSSPPNTELLRRKKHRKMDRLRRTLSFRSRKKGNTANNNNNNNNNNHSSTTTTTAATSTKNANNTPATTSTENKPSQWQDDEKSVRVGTCSFTVKVRGQKVLYK
jgi:lysozyme family protein